MLTTTRMNRKQFIGVIIAPLIPLALVSIETKRYHLKCYVYGSGGNWLRGQTASFLNEQVFIAEAKKLVLDLFYREPLTKTIIEHSPLPETYVSMLRSFKHVETRII